MMFITHMSFALFLGLLVLRRVNTPINNYLFMAVILIASILPDIDCADSFIGRKINPLSFLFKHRGFFHSLIMAVILGIIVFFITQNSYYALGFITGFLSHLFLDSLTKTGTAFFWPSKARIRGVFGTGRLTDWILLIVFILLSLLLFVY